MCGIVGCAGSLNFNDEKAFKQLLVLDSLRGEDSTGIARVQRVSGDVAVVKQLGDPFQLFSYRPFEEAMRGQHRVLIGHNRFATSGNVTRANAHPFEFNSLVGVHNGTLKNKWRLEDGNRYTVDSEALYNHIDKKGLRDAIDVVEGAYTLVWWDKFEETINFLRNEERPLFIARTKDNNVIYWASEAWMLSVVLNRLNIKHDFPEELEKDVHHIIHVDQAGKLYKPHLVSMEQPKRIITTPPIVTNKEVKKEEPKKDAKNNAVADVGFLNERAIELETLNIRTDTHGSKYIACFCPRYPFNIVRLYFRRDDPIQYHVGVTIRANINAWTNNADGGYYKADPWSIKFTVPVEDVEKEEKKALTVVSKSESPKEVKKTAKSVGDCAWCSSPIDQNDDYRVTSEGECVCSTCSNLPQVTDYVRFVH